MNPLLNSLKLLDDSGDDMSGFVQHHHMADEIIETSGGAVGVRLHEVKQAGGRVVEALGP